MIKKIYIDERFVAKFTVPKKYIKDLNLRYENAKTHLNSYGARLAGRLDSELNMMGLIDKTEGFNYIVKCMNKYNSAHVCTSVIRCVTEWRTDHRRGTVGRVAGVIGL